MNGFLHRLAAQAIGSTNALRTPARQPYSAPPAAVPTEEPDRQAATLETTVNKPQHVSSNAVEGESVYGQEQPRAKPHAKIVAQLHDNAQARENEVTPSTPEILVTQSATQFTTKPEREIARPSSAKTMSRHPQKNVKRTLAGESPVLAEGIETPIPLNNSATSSIANDEPYPTITDSAVPPPLLPLMNPARPSALNAGAAAQRGEPEIRAWQSQLEETTEVHVSIGRIEVTAVHESPPPKRQAPPTAKPMTLDEYLTRRQGKT